MSHFRPGRRPHVELPLSPDSVRRVVADALALRHFYIGPDVQLELQHVASEESSWEIFQGRLLDPAHTRQGATFETWNVYRIDGGARSGEPLLSVKFDTASGQVHVVRGLECYVWEGYDSGGNVFLSRERRKWARELIDTVHLEQFPDLDTFHDELICSLFHAVVGTSRLPLSSVEAPLPLFSFGALFFCYRSEPEPPGPWHGWQGLLDGAPLAEMSTAEKTRWLEVVLRVLPWPEMQPGLDRLRPILATLVQGGTPLPRAFRSMFNDLSLSPYHDFGERFVCVLNDLAHHEMITVAEQADLLAALLIQLGRHLTAYDLVTFHHRGANYPDALLLDALLKSYLCLLEQNAELAAGSDQAAQRRRRGLRQGWLLRRFYEDHLVPDAPTSPGENNRVLPSEPRVPEEQILEVGKRRCKLYDGDPLTAHLGPKGLELLRLGVRDLDTAEELRELGLALYLDRPLGDAKAAAEPDRTPLLASLAFSRAVARQRLHALQQEPLLETETGVLAAVLAKLDAGAGPKGLAVQHIGPGRRPAAVSLTDVRRAAADFVFLSTLPGSLAEFVALCDPRALERFRPVLLARSPRGDSLLVYDTEYRPRLQVCVDASAGYAVRANKEFSVAGLRVKVLD